MEEKQRIMTDKTENFANDLIDEQRDALLKGALDELLGVEKAEEDSSILQNTIVDSITDKSSDENDTLFTFTPTNDSIISHSENLPLQEHSFQCETNSQSDNFATEMTEISASNLNNLTNPTDRRITAEEFQKQIQQDSEEIQKNLSDKEYEELLQRYANNKTAEEIIKEKEEQKKKQITSMILPDGYINGYDDLFKDATKVSDTSDALVFCLEELGHVDIEYIAARTGLAHRVVISELIAKNAIYQNPKTWGKVFYKGWETADEYLSGNLMLKFRQASAEAKDYPELFDRNIQAIEKLFPDKILSDKIYVTIGSPWVPARYYNEFLAGLLNIRKISNGVAYDQVLKKWKVAYSHSTLSKYDVLGMTAVDIFENTLNNTPIRICDKKMVMGNVVWVLNKGRTLAAIERQKEIIAEFRSWIFNNDARKTTLENIYFEKYGSLTARKFDGSFLRLDGINPVVALYPHQRSAIARIIFSPSTLLSHSVGTGKTYIMIAAGMEMRRIGTSKKNMYVVPNAIIEQWRNDFTFLYPSANVFVADHRNMTPQKRQETLKKIKFGDYDAIIISYNSFKMIPVSLRYKRKVLENRFHEIAALNSSKYNSLQSNISVELAKLEVEIKNEQATNPNGVFFDDLGITSLFVDEAHNFKNITITSENTSLGVTKASSHQADDLLLKINLLRQKKVKSIVFATGTPITNSISDLFVMQTFLQPQELKFLGIDTFDSWALMFGEKTENFEMDVDSFNYRVIERFNKFHNLPELANIFAGVADFHVEDDDSLFVDIKRNTTIVNRSQEQIDYIMSLVERTQNLRNRVNVKSANQRQNAATSPANTTASKNPKPAGKKKKSAIDGDNLLKVTNDGRRMALDIRLVKDGVIPTAKTKIDACAEQVFKIYVSDNDVTQLVFCDISTPQAGFNVYSQLTQQLCDLGIPRQEIAFIQDGGNNAKKRQAIIDCMNEGAYKILIGSTPMLGTGVNVQKRLFAVHHLDVPWRPSDMVQREGRMIRQGNTNNVVEIYRYVTEGSFDAYSWQLLESKQRFISQLLSGSLDKRDGDEVDNIVLDYAEIKAIAIGDPTIKDRVKTFNELSRLKLLKMHRISRKNVVESNLEAYKKNLEMANVQQKMLEKDYKIYNKNNILKLPFKDLGDMIINECTSDKIRDKQVYIASYCGFDLVAPATCTAEDPVFYMLANYEKSFKLYNDKGLRMSNSEVARQIDRYLQSLPDIIKEVNKKKLTIMRNIEQAQQELDIPDDLDSQIEELTDKLNSLDLILGVKEDE